MRSFVLAALVSLLPMPLVAQIFADFQTSKGAFTCQLNETVAPRTVANFITLAEGTRAWLDGTTDTVSTVKPPMPFYNGLTFHRVIDQEGFRIAQGGSRTGDGTDGPGYTFPDECKASVPAGYLHDRPYLLSMANAGPNTNGAQFFLTGCAIPDLNGKHTVFGEVVTGQDVVEAILGVETDAQDKPVVPVVIQQVGIRRVGKAALKFNATRVPLPVVSAPRVKSTAKAGLYAWVKFKQPARSVMRLWSSYNGGTNWNYVGRRYLGWNDKPVTLTQIGLPPADQAPGPFVFRAVMSVYPADALTPSSLVDTQLQLSNESGEYLFHFSSTEASSYVLTAPGGGSHGGTITDLYYEPDGYGAFLIVDTSADGAFRFRLAPDQLSGAVLSGRQRGSFYSALYGWVEFAENDDFTWAPLP
jgi:cyclophilin family peptidyl-prolyl cis-trans isomerase